MIRQNSTNLQQNLRGASDKIGPDDLRYGGLASQGFNKRFSGRPDYVRLPGSTKQVVEAVQEAVQDNLRVTARSGRHCLEGFIADPAVRVVIDTTLRAMGAAADQVTILDKLRKQDTQGIMAASEPS